MSPDDLRALRRDKYDNDPDADLTPDLERLDAGEPLAYVIGWIPFLGLKVYLDSRPLIPRPETEWWTEKLIGHLKEKFGDHPFALLDLCAGSGAIGLAVLAAFPNAKVTFAELVPEHIALIRKNLEANGLAPARASFHTGDLFAGMVPEARFAIIAANPPYIPEGRELPESVSLYEPPAALFAGDDGLALVRRIAAEARDRLDPDGELWLECDTSHAPKVLALTQEAGSRESILHTDQYGRARLVVSYW